MLLSSPAIRSQWSGRLMAPRSRYLIDFNGVLCFDSALRAAFSHGSPQLFDGFKVAYLPEWRYEGANWETISEHTTHLLLFSLEMTSKGGSPAILRPDKAVG